MVIKRFLLLSGVVSLFLLNAPISVSALTGGQNALPGASNAADYQPPTGNPQNDVGGVSQGQTNQNNLQKPETVDQTALPNVADLRVSGVTSGANRNTTKTEVTQANSKKSGWAFIMLGTAAVAAVVLVLSSAKSLRKQNKTTSIEADDIATPNTSKAPVSETPIEPQSTNPQEPSKLAVKKTAKRKKGKNKKSKRKR